MSGDLLAVLGKLNTIEAKLDKLLNLASNRANAARAEGKGAPAASQAVASDDDLDGPYGDPTVRNDPKDWRGPSFAGCRFSECPPEYLDMLASLFEWRATKDDEKGARGEKNAKGYAINGKFPRMDAARARGWAARKRNGWAPPATQDDLDQFGGDPNDDSNIPF